MFWSDLQSWQNHTGCEREEVNFCSNPEFTEHLKCDNLEQFEHIIFLLPAVMAWVQPKHFSLTFKSEITDLKEQEQNEPGTHRGCQWVITIYDELQ